MVEGKRNYIIPENKNNIYLTCVGLAPEEFFPQENHLLTGNH